MADFTSSYNALTIDVEDWFHVCNSPGAAVVPSGASRVRQNVARILALLAEYNAKATFFVLGSIAEENPTLITEISQAGHEVASHGYSHTLVPLLGPTAFRDEVCRTGDILSRLTDCKPVGFRAPQWSLGPETPWALDILRDEGYWYDSSYNPLPFVGDRRGPRTPFAIDTAGGAIIEIPPMVTPSLIGNLPTGGGWGFRVFPLGIITATARKLNNDGSPAVFYLHPREMEAGGPRLSLSPLKSFAAYGPRTDAEGRLRHLLQSFKFCSLRQLVEEWATA